MFCWEQRSTDTVKIENAEGFWNSSEVEFLGFSHKHKRQKERKTENKVKVQ